MTNSKDTNKSIGVCGRNSENPYGRINTNEPRYPSVFSDLTRKEMRGLLDYLYSSKELNLARFRNATIRSNYLYLSEMFMPSKAAVLNYIDDGNSKPPREAHVVLIRGGDPKPNVLEIVVGPLPFPNGHRLFPYRRQPIPFFQRPFTSIESISQNLKDHIDKKFGRPLYELYGGNLINCGNKCLDVGLFAEVPISKNWWNRGEGQCVGVIIATYHGRQNPYSFEISENLMGLIHQHLYNFKVDMDIKGRNNRFETLDIENDVVASNEKPNSKIHQIKFARKLKATEKQAAYKHNFQQPKLLVISNNNIKDRFGNTPGYRILNSGLTHNIRPPGTGNEPGISWSNYQVAITKRKESEPVSSSIYQHTNPEQPIDIVAWITMGFYHIPTKEDLPMTHTPGTVQSFFLLPFNYFDENPAISSRNAIRIDPIDVKGETKSVKVERYGVRKANACSCIPPKNYNDKVIMDDPCLVVQCL
ncbi:putative amine oxidase [copper-containing] [Mytilus edulis]|uniref:putative amine oxidase [copper-containing] n=1 Tax=Mytilus edulis TaxID=6550 RepID=UPI0039F0E626